ncbi:MAG: hypothetical protein WCJ56_03135 [bacterium]
MVKKMVIVLLSIMALSVGLLGCGKTESTPTTSKPTGTATAANPGGAAPDRAAMTKYMEEHKSGMQLSQKVRNIAKLEKDGKAKLSAEQAKKILDVLKPLRSVQDIDEDTAKDVNRQVSAVLTSDQNTEMAGFPTGRGGRAGGANSGGNGGAAGAPDAGPGGPPAGAGGQGGGQGAPGGGQRAGGNRPPMDMEHFNPFYVKPDAAADDKGAHRWDEFFNGLESKAKGS